MKATEVSCTNEEQLQNGIKLCHAVKRHACLYDPESPGFQIRSAVAAAWKNVANECDDTASNCRFRWKTIRSSFSRSLRKSGLNSNYYLYDYLHFLMPFMEIGEKNDESTGQVEEIDLTQTEREAEVGSPTGDPAYNDSDTTKSAEETSKSDKNVEQEHSFTGINSAETPSPTKQLEESREGRPTRTRRMPKRCYEPEPTPEVQVEKRPRRVMERRKSLGGSVLKEYMQRHNLSAEVSEQETLEGQTLDNSIEMSPYKKDLKRTIQALKQPADVGCVAKPPTKDNSTLTETSWSADEKTKQCPKCSMEGGSQTLDDEFLETLRPQIKLMNFRQKINFKQRVYLALMDVLDDAKNFPNEGDVVELPAPLAKHFESATSGELRLMRELVSLVQAAKVSSEIVDATKNIAVVPLGTKTTPPPQHMDDGLEIVEETGEVRDNAASHSDSNSPITVVSGKSSDSLGIPRHILQRAVQVTGNTGGTLLAQNGDKRRVYRIFPKNGVLSPQTYSEKVNAQGSPLIPSTSSGTLYMTPPKPISKSVGVTNSSYASPSPNPLPPALRTAIQYPKIVKAVATTTPPAMLPPNSNKSPVLTNGHHGNTPTVPPKIAMNSSNTPSGSIYRRRYSICGPAPTGNSPTAIQQRLAPVSTSKTFTPPLAFNAQQQQQGKIQLQQQSQPKMMLQQQLKMKQQQQLKMQQHLQQQQAKPIQIQQSPQMPHRLVKPVTQPLASPIAISPVKIHISKAISLNSNPPSANSPKVHPGSVSTPTTTKTNNGILDGSPDNSDETSTNIPVLETAGTIAADSFEQEFPKPYIKLEPEE